jgi:hypothetical protein
MRAAIIALMLISGSQAGAESDNRCDNNWWKTVTEALLKVKLDKGINLKNVYIQSKDVCIMAFLGLHDLIRRIFQSAAI